MSRARERKRRSRHSEARLPFVVVAALVGLAILGVTVAVVHSPHQPRVDAGTLGMGLSYPLQTVPESFSAEETAVLSAPLPPDAVDVHVPVLMYHYVDAEPPPAGKYADGLTVRTPDFVEEMDFLADHGYHAVTLADVYLAMAGLKALPSKPVALTFDDGGLDNYTVAFPILEERHLAATFFVITKTVGAAGQMSWDQLREMAEAGMSIQSHTVSHPDLVKASASRLNAELVDSRTAIAQALNRPVYAVAYPSGSFDQTVVAAARSAGYVMGVATSKGAGLSKTGIFEITRRRVPAFLPLASFEHLLE
jgi:peptidoglycan/xylan/chitin deacetylase (PgdA/CDA1 family)